jgi:biopolymer transport protein ExbD
VSNKSNEDALAIMLKKRRENEFICRIDVTGLLAIQIVLLGMYIADAGVIRDLGGHGAAVELPKALHSEARLEADNEEALVIAITYNGQIYFDVQRLAASEIHEKLQDRVRSGAERKVYLKVDARAKYLTVKQVLVQVRLARIEKIYFLTQRARR